MAYTQEDLRNAINRGIQGKIGMLISAQDTVNETVREVISEVRIRSTRRKVLLYPNLLNGKWMYLCPNDLLAEAIIDIPAQATRQDGEFNLVPSEQWAREARVGDISIDDYNGVRVLLIRSATADASTSIDPLSAILTSPSGEWEAFGDAEDVEADTFDFIRGTGSISFNIDGSAGTTAGIFNSGLDHIDLSGFIEKKADIFTYARLTSATGVNAIQLRLGSGPSDYYLFSATAQFDDTAFAGGWNPIRLGTEAPSITGSPDPADITYAALYMTKQTSKINENSFAFNWLEARRGQYADVKYYGRFVWTDADGNYIENSDSLSDVLSATTDEFDLFAKKGRALAARETDLSESAIAQKDRDYEKAKENYMMKNPSEDKAQISTYWDYGSRDGGAPDPSNNGQIL